MWNDKSIENHFTFDEERKNKKFTCVLYGFWVVWMREKKLFLWKINIIS